MNRILDNGVCMSDVKIEKNQSLNKNIGVENSQYSKSSELKIISKVL